jgi:hypothetical protein
MRDETSGRAEQQGDGQPENERELREHSAGASGARADSADDARPEGGVGGTSDAGTAGDDAAESAALRRGLSDDKTRGRTPSAGDEG